MITQHILGVILCLIEFEVFDNAAAYLTEARKPVASLIIQFHPAVGRITENRLLDYSGQSVLEDTGAVGLLVYEIVGFGRVFDKVIQFRPGGLNILETVHDDPQQRIGAIRRSLQAFAIQPSVDGKLSTAKTSRKIDTLHSGGRLNIQKRANGWHDIN